MAKAITVTVEVKLAVTALCEGRAAVGRAISPDRDASRGTGRGPTPSLGRVFAAVVLVGRGRSPSSVRISFLLRVRAVSQLVGEERFRG